MSRNKDLSIKQELFCNYYLECGNASEAYRRAYSCKGWTDKSVWESASKLLNNPKVTPRIKELQEEMKSQSDISKDKILKELACIAFTDIRDFLTLESGAISFKDSKDWTEEMAHAVEGVKTTKEGIELKLHGKSWSISRICKMLGYDEPTVIDLKKVLLTVDTGTD